MNTAICSFTATLLVAVAPPASAVECLSKSRSEPYTVCSVDLKKEDLHIFLRGRTGEFFQTFERVNAALMKSGRELDFAMNGGMFETDLKPVGLLVVDGHMTSDINLRSRPVGELDGMKKPSLFYDLPNGVFWVSDRTPGIMESKYYNKRMQAELALQSGPVLVARGVVPGYLDNYNSPGFKRNAVCIAGAQKVMFVISDQPVGIRQFATFLARELRCTDALYLDGCRSALFSKQLARNDVSCPDKSASGGYPMGPIIGIVRHNGASK